METSNYYEILHRALRHDRSLMNFTSPEDIEVFERTSTSTYFDVYCETEGQPAFAVHCCDSVSNFDCDIEWL